MKIKRYFAADMRQAIRKVREEQGPDAVILSNRKVDGGIEIVAAIDYDEALVNEALGAPAPEARPAVRPEPSRPEPSDVGASAAPKPRVVRSDDYRPAGGHAEARVEPRKPAITWAQDPAIVEMRREIHELRGLLENQLAHLAWGDLQRRAPHTTELLRRLSDLGLTPALCRSLAEQVGPAVDEDQAWRRALGLLAHRLPVTDDDILNTGGVVALDRKSVV